MAGVKGRSGTNKGKDRPFADALRMEIAAVGEDGKALRSIARRLIAYAEEGKMDAIREIADRLDGKPSQAVEHSGGMTITHEDALDELDDRPRAGDQDQSAGQSGKLRGEVPEDQNQVGGDTPATLQ